MTHALSLPIAEFAFPGPLRDQLVAAILDGSKSSTTSLLVEYAGPAEALPTRGTRQIVVNSTQDAVAVIEITHVEILPLAEVGLDHARDEGEGFASVAEWRAGHEAYWHGAEMRTLLGDPAFSVTDATPVVLERFRVIRRLT